MVVNNDFTIASAPCSIFRQVPAGVINMTAKDINCCDLMSCIMSRDSYILRRATNRKLDLETLYKVKLKVIDLVLPVLAQA